MTLLGQACGILARQGVALPILVGGAVVEFDTASRITSGDLDLVHPDLELLAEALVAVGFRREDRRGRKLGGFYHPEFPIGVECVSSAYYEGRADRQRIRLVDTDGGPIRLAATEEMIADRLGQWEVSDRKDPRGLFQAQALAALAEELDEPYLNRRIIEETAGCLDLTGFRAAPMLWRGGA